VDLGRLEDLGVIGGSEDAADAVTVGTLERVVAAVDGDRGLSVFVILQVFERGLALDAVTADDDVVFHFFLPVA